MNRGLSTWVIGSDEAGYGSWAGSLVVAAVAVPEGWSDSKVTDSKKLSHTARVAAVRRYQGEVLYAVEQVTAEEIDERGVWTTVIHAHAKVHNKLRKKLLDQGALAEDIRSIVDGLENARGQLETLCEGPVTPMSKADLKVPAVSLASCFAKTGQCFLMDKLHEEHPQYGFNSHRGYGGGPTHQHNVALAEHGPVKGVHRFSYSSIKKLLK